MKTPATTRPATGNPANAETSDTKPKAVKDQSIPKRSISPSIGLLKLEYLKRSKKFRELHECLKEITEDPKAILSKKYKDLKKLNKHG